MRNKNHNNLKIKENIEAKIISRSWEDEKFKRELLKNTKKVLKKEFGIKIPDNIEIKILEENANTLYFIIPENPDNLSEENVLTDEELEVATGGSENSGTLDCDV